MEGITESTTIPISIGVLIILAGIIGAFLNLRNDVKHLKLENAAMRKDFDKLFKKVVSLVNWRERIKGASSVSVPPTGPLPPVQNLRHPPYGGDPGTPHPIPRDHTPISSVPFRIHDTASMSAYRGPDEDSEDSRDE